MLYLDIVYYKIVKNDNKMIDNDSTPIYIDRMINNATAMQTTAKHDSIVIFDSS